MLKATATLRPAPVASGARLVYRKAVVCGLLGVSSRTLDRLRSTGEFPLPDAMVGRAPVWTSETLNRWLDRGGSRSQLLPPTLLRD